MPLVRAKPHQHHLIRAENAEKVNDFAMGNPEFSEYFDAYLPPKEVCFLAPKASRKRKGLAAG
jgi:hypothetical protein